MAKKLRSVTDDELKTIVDAEIAAAMGTLSGDLAKERTRAMDRYLGEPIGTEMDGRSQVQTRDVMDVIEWIMPSLIRIFSDIDNAVTFKPVGPEDEEQAAQETEYINHLFYEKNDGFLVLYTWFKDALLQKNGIVMSYVEDQDKTTRETYRNLTDEQFNVLNSDDEYELIEHEAEILASDMGDGEVILHHATFLHKDKIRKICIDNIAPEEFLISRDARSVYPRDARFNARIIDITVSDLREQGYSETKIDDMSDGPGAEITTEELSRYNLSDEQDSEAQKLNDAMATKRLYECYLRADRNGDGIAERLKIMRSGDFIEIEEFDEPPFDALTPIILTHKFYGLSVADIIYDLQEIRSTLLRSYLDNVYQLINGKVYYNQNTVDLDDMLTSKPYGIVAVDGDPNTAVYERRSTGLPPEAFSLFELTDSIKQQRIGDFQSQIDPGALANTQTGVVIRLIGEAKAKTEMIARIFAETGVKSLFRYLHELTRKYADRREVVQLRNKWLPVDPREWRERTDLKVRVGLGNESREERIANAMDTLNLQERMVQGGGMGVLVTASGIYEAGKDLLRAQGKSNPDRYIQNPAMAQPPPPPPPDPQLMLIQAQKDTEMLKAQVSMQKISVEEQRSQRQDQIRVQEIQVKRQDTAAKAQLEAMRIDLQRIKDMAQASNDATKNAITERTLQIETQLRSIDQALESRNTRTDQMLEKYTADLAASVQLSAKQAGSETTKSMRMMNDLADNVKKLGDMLEGMQKPRKVVRDEAGKIAMIGDRKVIRDANGQITEF